jgi:hypothetical protein
VQTWSRGSLGFIGKVFGVMTQVDLGLTGLTRLILSLALMTVIKNLGRHMNQVDLGLTSVGRFDSADSAISANDAN